MFGRKLFANCSHFSSRPLGTGSLSFSTLNKSGGPYRLIHKGVQFNTFLGVESRVQLLRQCLRIDSGSKEYEHRIAEPTSRQLPTTSPPSQGSQFVRIWNRCGSPGFPGRSKRAQFAEGLSMLTITKTSTGTFASSSLNPVAASSFAGSKSRIL